VRAPSPTPVFIHHCSTDEKVLIDGCCEGHQRCCCGIGWHLKQCTSAIALFGAWLKLNKCVASHSLREPEGSACSVGVGCAANVTLCVHGGGCEHADWVDRFPAASSVLVFFAREACVVHGGQFSTTAYRQPICSCADGRSSRWCLDGTPGAARPDWHEHKILRQHRGGEL